MIKFEEMPQTAQKACNFTSKVRTAVMFVGVIIVGLVLISFISNKPKGIIDVLFGPVFAGGMIPGIVHGEFVYKKIISKLSMVGIIGLFIGVMLSLAMVMILSYIGFIFFIADIVLFVKKKKLVYPFEYKYFLARQDVQAEMEIEALHALEAGDAMVQIQKLKEMKDKGVISEEEFSAKKSELMARI